MLLKGVYATIFEESLKVYNEQYNDDKDLDRQEYLEAMIKSFLSSYMKQRGRKYTNAGIG